VPDGQLWLLPFELLPLRAEAQFTPAISQHPIVYLPNLSVAPLLLNQPANTAMPVIAHTSVFWTNKPEGAKWLPDRLASLPSSAIVDIAALQTLPSSRLLKTTASSWISLIPSLWNDPNLFSIAWDKSPREGALASWNQLPWGTPQSMWLMGADYQVTEPNSIGNHYRKLLFSLIAQGTQNIVISRWHVGGESSMILVENLSDYSRTGALSEAWQRSVANLWVEELNPSNERMQPKRSTSDRIPGVLPLYWSGYMTVGDTSP
jgi:hypothetical protein